jgi:hypothetical protein
MGGGFDFSSATVTATNVNGTLTLSVVNGTNLVLSRSGGGVPISGMPVQITVGGVRNPTSPMSTGIIPVVTQTNDGTPISYGTAPSISIQ